MGEKMSEGWSAVKKKKEKKMQKGQTANARENKKMRHLTFKTSLLSHLKFRTSPAETRSTERGASRYHAVPNVFARNPWLFSDKVVGRTPCERQCVKEGREEKKKKKSSPSGVRKTQNTVIKLKHSLSGEVPREEGEIVQQRLSMSGRSRWI